MKNRNLQSITDLATILLCVGLLFVPLAGSFCNLDFYPYEGENRVLAKFPELGNTRFEELPDALSDFANDHFGLRNTFIHGYNNFYQDILDMKIGRVSAGVDNWLFLDDNVKDYMGFRRFSDEQVAHITTSITKRYDWIKKQNIPFLMVVPPDKVLVHGDMLPDIIPSPNAVSRWKQVQAALPPLDQLNIVYLKNALVEARPKFSNLYYLNDTHWNYKGAYVAYTVILGELKKWFPALRPISLDDCEFVPAENSGDLPALMGRSSEYILTDYKILPKDMSQITTQDYPVTAKKSWHTWPKNAFPRLITNPKGKGRLLVFGDSFGYHLLSYLSQNFKQTAFFQMYASKANMKELIKEFNPDAILEVHLERMMDKFIDTGYYLD
ncbi:MAG: alginate O-acetyltransferase AlgX-related protein [Desulforhopalus sp.]